MRIFKYLAIIGLIVPSLVSGQSARQSPAALSTIPRGATDANHFWQHLVIDLTRIPSAGDGITINMPTGVWVADVDGDGGVAEEISVDNDVGANTGYNSAAGSDSSRIQLTTSTGGNVGSVHVQFPIATESAPTSASVVYGLITFSNSGETSIPAGTIGLLYAEPYQLSLANYSQLFVDGAADTTTNRQGDGYPESPAPAFSASLPDLVSDRSGSLASSLFATAGVPYSDSDDSNDVTFGFWFSATDSLAQVDTTTATVALDRTTQLPATANEGDVADISFDVSGLAAGTYYMYTTSNLTGTFPLVRSRGITVQHEPTVLSVGQFSGGDADFLDSGFLSNVDTGAPDIVANARDQLSITFDVVDYDDSASVRLFYATTNTLDTTQVTTAGTVPNRTITGLTGAVNVDSTASLLEGVDSALTWSIALSDTDFVAAGDYYIYAVVLDGTDMAIGISDYTYNVRHSPFIALDERADRMMETGGASPERYYDITWNQDNGIDGDIDRDDSALISLFYSDSDSFAVPGGVLDLQTAAADPTQDTHLIVPGLGEDVDGRENNRFVWDLWTHSNPDDGGVPQAGVPYYLYSVISGGGTDRIVRWEDGAGAGRTLQWTHSSHLRLFSPVEPMAVDGRQSFLVAWEARDVDDGAGIWVVLVPQSAGLTLGADVTYADFEADAAPEWIATSSDGSADNATPVGEDIASSFSVRPAMLVSDRSGVPNPLPDGEYYIYVVIDPDNENPPTAASSVLRAPGLVTIEGLAPDGATGLLAPTIEVLPAHTAMTVTGDTMSFEIRPHSAGNTVDVVATFLSIDTTFVRVVDQEAAVAGIQPFVVDASQPGLTLQNFHQAGADSVTTGRWLLDLVYFEQIGTDRYDGSSVLATVELVSKDSVGTVELAIDNLAQRESALYREGVLLAAVPPFQVSKIDIKPRGQVDGRVHFEGRTDHTAEITVLLRDQNSSVSITDSLFAAVNDVNATKSGVQDSTDSDGNFTLTKIPRGRYHLAVHLDRYLDGQMTGLEIDPGDHFTDVMPTVLADGVTASEFLLGGDVTGYVDSSGAALTDNEIDQLDVDFVVSFFGQATTPAHAGMLADIDGDSLVWVNDLNMVAANFSRAGVDPVYKRLPGDSPETATLVLTPEESDSPDEISFRMMAHSLSDLRAYAVKISYDQASLRLLSVERGDLFGSHPAVYATNEGAAGELSFGGALIGAGAADESSGSMARLRFSAGATSTGAGDASTLARISIERADMVGGGSGRMIPIPVRTLPVEFSLLPNYPNPFNPATAISLAVPAAAPITVDIFDTAGQRIRTLVRRRLSPGIHTFEWDGLDRLGRSVGSGVYFVRMAGPEFQTARKMTLLR